MATTILGAISQGVATAGWSVVWLVMIRTLPDPGSWFIYAMAHLQPTLHLFSNGRGPPASGLDDCFDLLSLSSLCVVLVDFITLNYICRKWSRNQTGYGIAAGSSENAAMNQTSCGDSGGAYAVCWWSTCSQGMQIWPGILPHKYLSFWLKDEICHEFSTVAVV